MKNASQWALASAAFAVGLAYACANPVELTGCPPGSTQACDIILAQASEFELDASAAAGQGGSAGTLGSVNPLSGGSAGTSSPPTGGSAGTNSPPGGGSAGTQGQSGSGQAAGAGGVSGSAGSGAGTGGAAGASGGSAGTSAGSAGTAAGTGGTAAQPTFDPEECDFVNRAGCETLACATACPIGMGAYCTTNCPLIIDCVAADPTCVTEQDPMCGVPFTTPTYVENTCTQEVNNSGGATTPGSPAFVAQALVRCLCSNPRPTQ